MTSRRWIVAAAAFLAAPVWPAVVSDSTPTPPRRTPRPKVPPSSSRAAYGKQSIHIPQAFILGPDSGGQIPWRGSVPVYLNILNSGSTPDTLDGGQRRRRGPGQAHRARPAAEQPARQHRQAGPPDHPGRPLQGPQRRREHPPGPPVRQRRHRVHGRPRGHPQPRVHRLPGRPRRHPRPDPHRDPGSGRGRGPLTSENPCSGTGPVPEQGFLKRLPRWRRTCSPGRARSRCSAGWPGRPRSWRAAA